MCFHVSDSNMCFHVSDSNMCFHVSEPQLFLMVNSIVLKDLHLSKHRVTFTVVFFR